MQMALLITTLLLLVPVKAYEFIENRRDHREQPCQLCDQPIVFDGRMRIPGCTGARASGCTRRATRSGKWHPGWATIQPFSPPGSERRTMALAIENPQLDGEGTPRAAGNRGRPRGR